MTSPEHPLSKHSAQVMADYLRRGAQSSTEWKCGLEAEFFGYTESTLERLDARQLQSVLAAFATTDDRLYYERESLLVELCVDGLGHLTIEPGGQVEFSGQPRKTLDEVEHDLSSFLDRLRAVADQQGVIFLAAGFDPLCGIIGQKWFPKMRYGIMRPYLALQGARAWDMMTRTCAIQVSLDFDSESDWSKKIILGNRLAPIVTAMFANSPFAEGKLSGYKSTRAAAWLKTDDARSGLSPVATKDGVTFEDYVAYAMDVPMIFARRNGIYTGAPAGILFADFLGNGAAGLDPIFQDWTDHLTTIFTDSRAKPQCIELRSADCGSSKYALALAALWKGLFYEGEALSEALRLMPCLDTAAAFALREEVARDGLAARAQGVDVLALAKDLILIATDGLRRTSPGEVHYLDILHERVLSDEVSPADVLLRNWNGLWHSSMAKVIKYLKVF